MNERLQWQVDNKLQGLKFFGLDLHTAKIYVFVDGSSAGNRYLSSQIGFVIVLGNEVGNDGNCFILQGNILDLTSVKCRRVTKSVLASELYGMVGGIDVSIAIKTTLDKVWNQLKIPSLALVACIDSYSLYDCLVKLGTITEKRLMIDLISLRESYESCEIAEISWIDEQDNPTDSMTNINLNYYGLRLLRE